MVNAAPRSSKLARLKRYIPQFFGTLRLEGRMDDVGQFQPDAEADIPEVSSEAPQNGGRELIIQSVVLQNLSYAFTKPNIMDAKLGTVLYEPGATEEKKAKMEKQARETTIGSTGLRLTGCQVSYLGLNIDIKLIPRRGTPPLRRLCSPPNRLEKGSKSTRCLLE